MPLVSGRMHRVQGQGGGRLAAWHSATIFRQKLNSLYSLNSVSRLLCTRSKGERFGPPSSCRRHPPLASAELSASRPLSVLSSME